MKIVRLLWFALLVLATPALAQPTSYTAPARRRAAVPPTWAG